MKKRFTALLGLLLASPSWSQSQRSIELAADYGFLFLHSQDLAPIGRSYPRALNFSYAFWLDPEQHWANCRCFPRLGLSTGFHYFDNPSVLGVGLPFYGFLEPWWRLSDHWFLNVRGGLGGAWQSRPYDEEGNPLNLSYSLPFSIYAMVGLGVAYQLSPHWRLNLQMRYNHTSNGGIREPNKGLNYPTASLAFDYALSPVTLAVPEEHRHYHPKEAQKVLRFHIFAAAKAGAKLDAGGVEERDLTYLVSGINLRYSQQINRLSALSAGTEWVNNQAYREQIERRGLNRDFNQVSFLLGHEFLLGRFVLSQQVGFYLYKDYGPTPDWYQRYGLLWYPWDKFSVGGNIKVHGHIAEFIDFRLGYAWPL